MIYSKILAILAILGDLLAITLLVILIFYRSNETGKKIINFFGKNSLLFSFLIALFATAGSLIYSEFLKFPPCPLCWYQRIFMYPIVILTAMAWRFKENINKYIIALASIGGLFSLYHYLLEFGIVPSTFCSAEGVSCAQRLVFEFGFVSLPFMTLTGFILIILFAVANNRIRSSVG